MRQEVVSENQGVKWICDGSFFGEGAVDKIWAARLHAAQDTCARRGPSLCYIIGVNGPSPKSSCCFDKKGFRSITLQDRALAAIMELSLRSFFSVAFYRVL